MRCALAPVSRVLLQSQRAARPRAFAMATAQPRTTAAPESTAGGAAASTRPSFFPSFSVLLLGDTMLGRLVDEQLRALQLRGEGPERVWGDTLPLAEAADVRLLNLECAITDHLVRHEHMRRFASDPRLTCRAARSSIGALDVHSESVPLPRLAVPRAAGASRRGRACRVAG